MTVIFASNQGDVGGGEVMLLAMAEAARSTGHDVLVVAPQTPDTLLTTAQERGFTCTGIPGSDAVTYLRNLRRWDASREDGLLWCNGLRPALATAGHARRVVHLHQIPSGLAQRVAARIATLGSRAVVVPSRFVAEHVKGARVLSNWADVLPAEHESGPGRLSAETTVATEAAERTEEPGASRPWVVGYLGRLSVDKGLTTLCAAVDMLRTRGLDVHLLVAGEHRFVPQEQVEAVEDALTRLGDHVERRGWMERGAFFAAVDIAVFPSQWPEPFGLVAAEAMAARSPFVVSDAGGLPEVVGQGYPWIFAAADAEALADTLQAALAQDDATRAEVVESAHARWRAHFSPDAGRARFMTLLETVHRREDS